MPKLDQDRRNFLKSVAATAAVASPMIGAMAKPPKSASFDPSFGTASEAMAAMSKGRISSRELTAHVFARIQQYNPKINAFITLCEEQAMQEAARADEARAHGKTQGKLHGLPILVKDAWETRGVRTTFGNKETEHNVPQEDAAVVERLKAAGAIIVGKTSLPPNADDVQTYNEIIGTTNNPWDLTRTAGGSTGGGAAALATGMGFLEIGTDLGGSIRIPASFCGVYGHKSSVGVVPLRGNFGSSPPDVQLPDEVIVAGPLARSAQDLALELGVIGGPDGDDATAYVWRPPPPRKPRLRDYKIGFVLDDPFCPVEPDVRQVLEDAVAALRSAGVQMVEGWPEGYDPMSAVFGRIYFYLALSSIWLSDKEFQAMVDAIAKGKGDPISNSYATRHRDWLQQSSLLLKRRAQWQTYFKSFDAFLMPVIFLAAFPHNFTLPYDRSSWLTRRLQTSTGERPYADTTNWIATPTYLGLPATSAPVGLTKSGLPVGLQIMGPYLEDATAIDIAAKLAEIHGGFVPPPGFA